MLVNKEKEMVILLLGLAKAQKTAQRSQVCFVEGLQESINFLDEAEKDGK